MNGKKLFITFFLLNLLLNAGAQSVLEQTDQQQYDSLRMLSADSNFVFSRTGASEDSLITTQGDSMVNRYADKLYVRSYNGYVKTFTNHCLDSKNNVYDNFYFSGKTNNGWYVVYNPGVIEGFENIIFVNSATGDFIKTSTTSGNFNYTPEYFLLPLFPNNTPSVQIVRSDNSYNRTIQLHGTTLCNKKSFDFFSAVILHIFLYKSDLYFEFRLDKCPDSPVYYRMPLP